MADMSTVPQPAIAQPGGLKLRYWRLHDRINGVRKRAKSRAGEIAAIAAFIADGSLGLTLQQRVRLMRQFLRISRRILCHHTQAEMIAVARSIFSLPRSAKACVVEAGCFRGGSGAKLSLCAALAGRQLYLFDSFEGIPVNSEAQVAYGKRQTVFEAGQYTGSLDEVRANITRYGVIDVCHFVKGWFSDTMPGFSEPVGTAFIDVDLISSTKDCLINLYPRVIPGGAIFSQDAHLSGVAALLEDKSFWREEVGVERPPMRRLASPKLMRIEGPRRA